MLPVYRYLLYIYIYTERPILTRFIQIIRLYLPGQPRPAFPPMEQQSAFYIRVSMLI